MRKLLAIGILGALIVVVAGLIAVSTALAIQVLFSLIPK